MKTVEFTYTDAKGKESTRALIVLVQPGSAYEGIDVSEMPSDEFGAFAQEYSDLREKQIKELQELQEKFDLKHSYRRFLVERMTDIKVV